VALGLGAHTAHPGHATFGLRAPDELVVGAVEPCERERHREHEYCENEHHDEYRLHAQNGVV